LRPDFGERYPFSGSMKFEFLVCSSHGPRNQKYIPLTHTSVWKKFNQSPMRSTATTVPSFLFSTTLCLQEKHLLLNNGIVLEHAQRSVGTWPDECLIIACHRHADEPDGDCAGFHCGRSVRLDTGECKGKDGSDCIPFLAMTAYRVREIAFLSLIQCDLR
jgi:hypothetical protein